MTRRVVIAGAAGRDFHNFNVVFRGRDEYEVVAFTATQIPNIDDRRYPPELAGDRYPNGIPIVAEEELAELVARERVDEVVFAYSDVTHEHVMHIGSIAMAAGADFVLLGPRSTMLASDKPVVAVCAVRTGSGKSQTTRHVAAILRGAGQRVAVLRHPMPYGDLTREAVQRFENYEDLEAAEPTIEEREEYEPHLAEGNLVFAGIDYAAILSLAEEEADVIVWDGGNNDTPFIRPDLHVVVVDPHRPGHELRYHPGETNLRMADVCVVNKTDTAPPQPSPSSGPGPTPAGSSSSTSRRCGSPTGSRSSASRRSDPCWPTGGSSRRPRRSPDVALLTVVALGGNALLRPGQRGTAAEHRANLAATFRAIAPLLAGEVVLTHGNGPQVGNELLRQELAAAEAPPLPLWVAVAQTQAEIGTLIAAELRPVAGRPVAVVATHVLVAEEDPAFGAPTKPIGPFYDAREAEELERDRGWSLREDAGRGWRRVVPSPRPP